MLVWRNCDKLEALLWSNARFSLVKLILASYASSSVFACRISFLAAFGFCLLWVKCKSSYDKIWCVIAVVLCFFANERCKNIKGIVTVQRQLLSNCASLMQSCCLRKIYNQILCWYEMLVLEVSVQRTSRKIYKN